MDRVKPGHNSSSGCVKRTILKGVCVQNYLTRAGLHFVAPTSVDILL